MSYDSRDQGGVVRCPVKPIFPRWLQIKQELLYFCAGKSRYWVLGCFAF